MTHSDVSFQVTFRSVHVGILSKKFNHKNLTIYAYDCSGISLVHRLIVIGNIYSVRSILRMCFNLPPRLAVTARLNNVTPWTSDPPPPPSTCPTCQNSHNWHCPGGVVRDDAIRLKFLRWPFVARLLEEYFGFNTTLFNNWPFMFWPVRKNLTRILGLSNSKLTTTG